MGLSTNPKELTTPYKINSSYYIEANNDNNTKFKRLKILLTKFDHEDDLLINFSNKKTEETESEVKDRAYWEESSSRESFEALDACFKIINEVQPDTKFNYTKSYIGLTLNSKHTNIARLIPKHSFLKVYMFVDEAEEWIKKLEAAGFKVHLNGRDSDRFIFRIDYENILPNKSLLRDLFVAAYGYCRD